jgi:hypothetical protein
VDHLVNHHGGAEPGPQHSRVRACRRHMEV